MLVFKNFFFNKLMSKIISKSYFYFWRVIRSFSVFMTLYGLIPFLRGDITLHFPIHPFRSDGCMCVNYTLKKGRPLTENYLIY